MLRLLTTPFLFALSFFLPNTTEAHDHHKHKEVVVEDHEWQEGHDYVHTHRPWYHRDHVYFYNGHSYPYYYSGHPYYYYDPRFYYYTDEPAINLNVNVK